MVNDDIMIFSLDQRLGKSKQLPRNKSDSEVCIRDNFFTSDLNEELLRLSTRLGDRVAFDVR